MRILFYVEPHGLRDEFTSHMLPFRHFVEMANQINNLDADEFGEVEARVFSNHFVADAGFAHFYDHWPAMIQPTIAEQTMIEDSAKMWMGGGLDDWVKLMTDQESDVVKKYVDVLMRIKREVYDYDVIVVWGENAAVRQVAKRENLQLAFFELASMRTPFPRSLLVDPIGVNGAASTSLMHIDRMRDTIQSLPIELIPMLINEEFAKGRQNTVLPNSSYAPLQKKVRAFFEQVGPKAFVPLQLADDANQLIYSEFSSVHTFAKAAIEPLIEAGFKVILKPHPSARERGGHVMRQQRLCLKRYADCNNVLVLSEDGNNEDYLPMLRAVDLVVTNNSSAGFEASMMGTRVSVLGSACYAPKGGFPTLAEAIGSFSDEALAKKWDENRDTIVTYLLACSFPLDRGMGRQLVRRLKIWKASNDIYSFDWMSELFESVGWSTWHQKDFLKQITKIVKQ